MDALSAEISEETGQEVEQITPLTGGCVGEVYRVWLGDGTSVVAKTGQPGDPLDIEGWMLDYLADHSSLPVPKVILARDSLLVMSYIDGEDALSPPSEIHAAELLAALHDVTADDFGLERDTGIVRLRFISFSYAVTKTCIDYFSDITAKFVSDEQRRMELLMGAYNRMRY